MKEKKKSYIGLRHPVLLPGNERFISPARDIAYLSYPVVKGALAAIDPKVAGDTRGTETACELARELAVFFNKALVSKISVTELLADLRAEFEKKDPALMAPVALELLFGFLTAFALGCRESTSTDVLGDEELAGAVGQASLLSALPEPLREQVVEKLMLRRIYCKELDRSPLRGTIERPVDDDTHNGG